MNYRRTLALWLITAGACAAESTCKADESQMVKYARFRAGKVVAYGIVEGERIRRLDGNLFAKWSKTEETFPLVEVKLLAPTRPAKVLALAGNYKSHLNTNQPVPHHPEPFFKLPSCLIGQDETIMIPKGATDVHFEAELVIVIGKRAKNVAEANALDHVLGVTCGNDISERAWQKADRQWWRAKGSDTFGPCGPFIVSGIPYDNLSLELRLNGEVKQKTRTSEMIHGVAATVSFISQFVTLEPGDLIYTGTPGTTSALKAGDVVEVEMEGVGVLRNKVAAAK